MSSQNTRARQDVQPAKQKSTARRVLGGVVGILVVIGEGFAVTGDDDDLEKVDCSGAEAQYQVRSRVDGTHDAEEAWQNDPEAMGAHEYEVQSRSVDVTEFVPCFKYR